MYAHINLTQKTKTTREKIILKNWEKKIKKKIQKLCDMYIDEKGQVQKTTNKNNNIAINLSKAKIIK